MKLKSLFQNPFRFVRIISALALLLNFSAHAATFDAQIAAFEAQDAVNPPPAEPVLFVGSSTIVGWKTVAADFPYLPVINRGFGGSQMSDVLYYFDRVVAAYKPSLVVVYEGDNDVISKTVDQIFADYTNFLGLVRTRLPGTDVAFISVKPSPSRVSYMEKMRELNLRIQTLCDGLHTRYIDTFYPMLDGNGQPRPELFNSDMLHLNSLGYELWKTVVGPVLQSWNLGRGQELFFDFGATDLQTVRGPAPNDPARSWNNVTAEVGTSPLGMISNLVTALEAPTPMGFVIVSRFTGPNSSGTIESPLFPPNAARDSLYGNTEAWIGLENIFPSFKLTGLDPQLRYFLTFYGSRVNAADNRETIYTVQGSASAFTTLNAANNVSSTAVVEAVLPSSSGEITVSMAPGPNNNNVNHFTYLNVMKLDVVPPQTPIAFVTHPANQDAGAYQVARFSAAVTGARPYRIQWYRNGTSIPGANSFRYEVIATPELDQAVFTVGVSNLVHGSVSEAAVLTVTRDTTPPVLVGVSSATGESIELSFNEPLASDAAASGTFKINGIAAAGARLSADGASIIVTPLEPVIGEFAVTVSGVRDLSGNAMPETLADGKVSPLDPIVFLVDFGGTDATTADPVVAWNNLTTTVGTSPTGVLPGLVSTQNKTSNISIQMVRRFNGNNASGTSASGVYPANATRDSLFGNTETFSGLSGIYPSFKLTGLDSAWRYDLTFYASRMSSTDNRDTGYTVVGATTNFTSLNAANNASQRAILRMVAPDDEGQISISLAPTPNNNNSYHFTYLGVLELRAVFPPRLLSPSLGGSEVRLQWIGPGILQSAIAPGGPWNSISPAHQNSHVEPVLPGGSRFYRLIVP
jgi:lysophospholipase L1-like esterase